MNKIKIILLLVGLFYANVCFAQSGWFWQNPLPQGINFTKLDFINYNVGYLCGGVILKTTDSGNNWYVITTGNFGTIDFLDVNTGFSVEGYRIFRTNNGASNWTQVLYETTLFNPYIYFLNNLTGFVCGGNNASVLLKTTTGGNQWFSANVGGYNDRLRGIFFLNDYTGFIASGYGVALKTTDQGFNWTIQTISYPPSPT